MRAITPWLLCLVPLVQSAHADTLTGTAGYRERIAPPPDARFVAVIEDVSRADAPAVELARVEFLPAGGPPYAFAIDYDAAALDPAGSYTVRASLLDAGGRLLFTTDSFTPVLTRGGATSVDLTMTRVAAQADPAAQTGVHGLRLPASLSGTLPCPDCDGIAVQVMLWPDQTYHLSRTFLGREGDPTEGVIGRWHADPATDTLVLAGGGAAPERWKVTGPDSLLLLNDDGTPVEPGLTADATPAEPDLAGLRLQGMMTYMADAAIFVECQSGRTYPVAQEGGYLDLERAYLANRQAPGAPLYVEVEGSLALRPAMEGPDRRSLVVDRFVQARPGMSCAPLRVPATLTGGYWRLDALAGEPVTGLADRRAPYLVLLEGETPRFAASVGCNQMAGSFSLEGEAISFGQAAMTMMACPPPLDNLERDLAAALSSVQSLRLVGDRLELVEGSGAAVVRLTAVDRP